MLSSQHTRPACLYVALTFSLKDLFKRTVCRPGIDRNNFTILLNRLLLRLSFPRHLSSYRCVLVLTPPTHSHSRLCCVLISPPPHSHALSLCFSALPQPAVPTAVQPRTLAKEESKREKKVGIPMALSPPPTLYSLSCCKLSPLRPSHAGCSFLPSSLLSPLSLSLSLFLSLSLSLSLSLQPFSLILPFCRWCSARTIRMLPKKPPPATRSRVLFSWHELKPLQSS